MSALDAVTAAMDALAIASSEATKLGDAPRAWEVRRKLLEAANEVLVAKRILIKQAAEQGRQ